MAGVLMVVVLIGVVMYNAFDSGFPSIRSGDLPLVRAKLSRELPGAICVVSYAFYLQPMLLPMLREMPAGKAGVDLTCRATQLVTTGVSELRPIRHLIPISPICIPSSSYVIHVARVQRKT
jgi:sodium-coupled neutral amino acid transporter 11